MSSSNGAVGVMVQVPVLGTVSGVRTVKSIIAGTPVKLPTDQPAVTYRDPGEPIKVATAAPPKVDTKPDPPSGITVAPTPKPTPTPKPVGTSDADPEANAKRLMQLAENYLNASMKPMAIRKLKEILSKYPKTKTALDAEVKLAELEG